MQRLSQLLCEGVNPHRIENNVLIEIRQSLSLQIVKHRWIAVVGEDSDQASVAVDTNDPDPVAVSMYVRHPEPLGGSNGVPCVTT